MKVPQKTYHDLLLIMDELANAKKLMEEGGDWTEHTKRTIGLVDDFAIEGIHYESWNEPGGEPSSEKAKRLMHQALELLNEDAVPSGNVSEREIVLTKKLTMVFEHYGMVEFSETPNPIFAEYIMDCIRAWNKAMQARSKWYGGNV